MANTQSKEMKINDKQWTPLYDNYDDDDRKLIPTVDNVWYGLDDIPPNQLSYDGIIPSFKNNSAKFLTTGKAKKIWDREHKDGILTHTRNRLRKKLEARRMVTSES